MSGGPSKLGDSILEGKRLPSNALSSSAAVLRQKSITQHPIDTSTSSYQEVQKKDLNAITNSDFKSTIADRVKKGKLHWGWLLAFHFSKLISAIDIDIKGMAVNGKKKGCHHSEGHPIGNPPGGCNTKYTAGTVANSRLEARPVAGKQISQVYRFYVQYNQPITYKYKGIIPVHTHGFYSEIGPNWNKLGTICNVAKFGLFSKKPCEAHEQHSNIPLGGIIPQNWARDYGTITYALDYPFSFAKAFHKSFLGVWGMVDRETYERMKIPYLMLPMRLDHAVELLSTIDKSRATHINLNKPYDVKGTKPHIEWLDLHNAKINILFKDGIIDLPGVCKVEINRNDRTAKKRLDSDPHLLAIASEWRKHKQGSTHNDRQKSRQLAFEYHRLREWIKANFNRVDVKSTENNIRISIYKPTISFLEMPIGSRNLKLKDLSIENIVVTLPSMNDLRSKKRKISEASVQINGISAGKASFIDPSKGMTLNANNVKIGSITLTKGSSLNISNVNVSNWFLNINQSEHKISSSQTHIDGFGILLGSDKNNITLKGLKNSKVAINSPLFDFNLNKSKANEIKIYSNGAFKKVSIRGLSTETERGRIGSVKFGEINLESGSIGRGSLKNGSLDVEKADQEIKANIGGLIEIMIGKTDGSNLDFSVPGLSASGELRNIHISGPANFTFSPQSLKISKLPGHNNATQKLGIKAHLVDAIINHDPTIRDAKIRNNPAKEIIRTQMEFSTADLGIEDVRDLSFEIGQEKSQSRFRSLQISGLSISNITGKGHAWLKIPPWQYLRTSFKKLTGSFNIESVSVKSNGQGKNSEFKNVDLNLKEKNGETHKCSLKLPLLSFSPNNYFIGDPSRKPLKIDCHFDAKLRGGYFHFRNKQRPLEKRRPYR